MPLISHRGASGLADANSPDSIQEGDKYNPAFIEVDVNCTADNIIVIYHGSISRFLSGNKTSETYEELKQKYPFLMTFSEFLVLKTKSPYIFDLKVQDEDTLSSIATALHTFSRDDFAFTSPHETAMVYMKKQFPDSLFFQSQPYHHGPTVALEIARKNNFDGIALNKWWLTPIVYNICKAHGKKINAYTIDSAFGIWLAQRMFPSAYITTNRPDTYRRIFPKG